MLALRMDPAAPLLRHVVWLPNGGYLVPRLDGRLIVGGTVEERGFDDNLTAGGLLALLDGAWRAVPTIEDLPVAETWVGFRPGSRDDAPMLGPGAIDGLVVATGHHRNGILLTPVTAQAISQFVLTGRLPEGLRRFSEPDHDSDHGQWRRERGRGDDGWRADGDVRDRSEGAVCRGRCQWCGRAARRVGRGGAQGGRCG